MKAQILAEFGPATNFRMSDVPTPEAGRGEVLLQVMATSVNPADYKSRANGPAFAPTLPAVLGSDVAGIVSSVGDGVEDFVVGDRVFGCAGGVRGLAGAYAEYMTADCRLLAPIPTQLDWREAAALPLVSITAYEALVDRAHVEAGNTVLVLGAVGGVGHVAIQLAKALGAQVIGAVSSLEKAETARSLGADHTVLYTNEDLADRVHEITNGRGADVVFDASGTNNIAECVKCVAIQGQIVLIVSRFDFDLTNLMLKGVSLHVVFMLLPLIENIGRARHGEILQNIGALAASGKIRPLIDGKRFTLAQLPQAHDHAESGRSTGKVVVDVSSDEAAIR